MNMKRGHSQVVGVPRQPKLHGRQYGDSGDNLSTAPQHISVGGAYPLNHPYETGVFLTGPLPYATSRTWFPPTHESSYPSASSTLEAVPTIPSAHITLTPTHTPVVNQGEPRPEATRTGDSEVDLESADSQKPGAKPSSLPSGAVIGLVIALIALMVSLAVYLIRRRYVQRRIRLRKDWARSNNRRLRVPGTLEASQVGSYGASPLATPAPTPSSPTARAPPQYPLMASRGIPLTPTTRPRLPSPAIPTPVIASYGTDYSSIHSFGSFNKAMSPVPSPQRTTTGPVKKLLTPIYGPPAAVLSKPISAVVISTFITTLPDELQVAVGEVIQLLSQFDDGWALCLNAINEQGMVPLECLDRRDTRGNAALGGGDTNRGIGGRTRRVSSLNPNAEGRGRF